MSPEERARYAITSGQPRPLSARVTAAIRSARAEAFREAAEVAWEYGRGIRLPTGRRLLTDDVADNLRQRAEAEEKG